MRRIEWQHILKTSVPDLKAPGVRVQASLGHSTMLRSICIFDQTRPYCQCRMFINRAESPEQPGLLSYSLLAMLGLV